MWKGRTVVLCLLACAACSQAQVRNRAEPLADDPSVALAWMPPNIKWISHQYAGQIALFEYVKAELKENRPTCFDQISKDVDHLFMLSRFLGDTSVNAVHGIVDRSAAEQCAVEVYKAMGGGQVTISQDGAYTSMWSDRGVTWLAWSKDGWLYYGSKRERLISLLNRTPVSTLSPMLRLLLRRVALHDGVWSVFAGDALGLFVNVSSTGLILRLRPITMSSGARSALMPVTFLLASDGDAHRAVESISAAGRDESMPAPLRGFLATLRPQVRGTELEMEISALFQDEAAQDAAMSWAKLRLACTQGDTSSCTTLSAPGAATQSPSAPNRVPDEGHR